MYPASTRVPRRAPAPAATGALFLASLLLLISTFVVPTTAQAVGVPLPPADERDPSEDEVSAIVSAAMQYLGSNQGECFPWVRRVVQEALGRQMGFDYHAGYLQAGAVEITAAEARVGDIVQIADPANTGPQASYPGLHTAIVLTPQGNGVFRMIDSNSQFDGVVRIRENYNPAEVAARYPNTVARFYRFPEAPLAPAAASAPAPATLAANQAVVRGDGDCLRLRSAPTLSAAYVLCVPDGSTLSLLGTTAEADGYTWQLVSFGGTSGWVASEFIEVGTGAQTVSPALAPTQVPTAAAAPTATPPPAATPALTISQQTPPAAAPAAPAREFVAPVEGGLTQGIAGTNDPVLLADSQPFEVESISALEVETQRFLIYIPGAPDLVNSLTSSTLRADAVVTIRRMGTTPTPGPAPSTVSTVPAGGTPNTLLTPPPEGLTQGMAGTNNPSALVSAQPFPIRSVSALDVATQRWLVYIVGAPGPVNTLHTASMTPESIVTVRRAGDGALPAGGPPAAAPAPSAPPSSTPAPAPTATVTPTPEATPTSTPTLTASTTGEPQTAGISYYYCEEGSLPQGIGDGGGFCGGMANGQQVHEGAAGCSPRSLGQRFRILGDPTGRVYTCSDVGATASDSHREVWFPNSDAGWTWRQTVGETARIEILAE